ncbi:ribonuclease H family protein [Candidatus Nitrospira neomarina]|uniref:ribonuclease H n=1 Tax=Candidatus Nitrospira neomarina TaxID=3020899 RepID=A0AA96JVC4_9BACT|nr:ribonuclease H family protein [Candidatus Nitrospira neomarina]WNM61632.1 ribonuclease H family protein [Candidatus Nitrospira neomarina]
MKFYAVRRGRTIGIFESWDACRAQVHHFPGAEYKAFPNREEAEAFLSSRSIRQPTKKNQATATSSSMIEVWVDGSCFPKDDGTLRLGWGVLVKKNGVEIHRDKGNDIPQEAMIHRNVAGEILAILKAIKWCQSQGITEMTIYFDYQGLESWATGAWRTKLPFTQAYAQTINESGITIHWVKVKAHSGNPENDLVDQLAKEGAMGK